MTDEPAHNPPSAPVPDTHPHRGGWARSRFGPPTACQAAADDYRTRLGWPCGSLAREAWIALPMAMTALTVPRPQAHRLAGRLAYHGLLGPIIGRPDNTWVFLAHNEGRLDPIVRKRLVDQCLSCAEFPELVSLPPTRLVIGELTWVRKPNPDARLPELTMVLGSLYGLSHDVSRPPERQPATP